VRGTWREGSLLGTLEDVQRKAVEMGVCFYRDTPFGLLHWGPWRMCRGRLWKWASVSIGTPLLGSSTGDPGGCVEEGCGNGRLFP